MGFTFRVFTAGEYCTFRLLGIFVGLIFDVSQTLKSCQHRILQTGRSGDPLHDRLFPIFRRFYAGELRRRLKGFISSLDHRIRECSRWSLARPVLGFSFESFEYQFAQPRFVTVRDRETLIDLFRFLNRNLRFFRHISRLGDFRAVFLDGSAKIRMNDLLV
jgi:hypothetical protein